MARHGAETMVIDRLPLVQALTQAGLERAGAEQVATALGDAIESSVASKADVGRVDASIARVDASIARVDASVQQMGAVLRAEMAQLGATMRAEMSTLENRLLIRLGGLMITVAGILFTALRFVGHPP